MEEVEPFPAGGSGVVDEIVEEAPDDEEENEADRAVTSVIYAAEPDLGQPTGDTSHTSTMPCLIACWQVDLLRQLRNAQEVAMRHLVEAEILRGEVERLKVVAAASSSPGAASGL